MLDTWHVIEEFVVRAFTLVCVVTSQLPSTNRIVRAKNRSWHAFRSRISIFEDNTFDAQRWRQCKCIYMIIRWPDTTGRRLCSRVRFTSTLSIANLCKTQSPHSERSEMYDLLKCRPQWFPISLSSSPALQSMFYLWVDQFYWSTICQFASKTTKLWTEFLANDCVHCT